jgi:hypothetical protein
MDKVIAGEGKGSRTAARIARFSSSKGAQAILKAVNHGTRGAAAGAMAAGLANVMDLALPFRQGLVDYNLPGRLVGSAPDNVAAGGGIPAGEAPSNSPYGYNAANPEVNYAGSPVSPSGSEGGVSGNLVGVTPGGGLPGGEQAVPGAQDLVINVTQEPTANTVWEAARNTAKNLVEGTDWTNAATGADKTEVLGDFIKDILEAKGQSIQTVQPGTSFDLTKILDPDQLIQFNQLVGQINATTDVTSYIPVHNQVVDFVASLKS